ncbi:cadherin EGF LAG seven-pass G-type receptor 1-like [Physella acuta]|uniref:cadherin EGF LAG seven-pass G-type receptor 1-like n=1 Tax=Physella acuta TaxID=109671 RepID=UPI0027DC2957|nr:cadherin EGF LAG seven-pass G-type receptor 1-like [Physella acuta]
MSRTDVTGTSILKVVATDLDDPDTNNNGRILYSLAGSPLFSINSTSGVIRNTAMISVDNRTTFFFLKVTATDSNGGAGALSSAADVTITVSTFNQYSPVFSSTNYSVAVRENQLAAGDIVLNVSASDLDLGPDGEIILSLVTLSNEFFLTQNGNTGELRLKLNLDYDKGDKNFTLSVTAADKGIPAQSSTCIVTVTVINENDNPPVCTPFIKIDRLEGLTDIVSLDCSDADLESSITYSVLNISAQYKLQPIRSAVSIDGRVTVIDPLNYENTPDFSILIKVVDNGTPALSTTVTVLVHVTDVNDNTPSFVGNLTFSLQEELISNTVVFRVEASGNDGPLDVVGYWLLDTTYFFISPVSGDIVLIKPAPDFDTYGDKYIFGVCVHDTPNPLNYTTCSNITVNLIDINDEIPSFTSSMYAAVVSEDTVLGYSLLPAVSAIDRDRSSMFNTVTYSIVEGNVDGCFKITSGGYLEIVKNIDYEKAQEYILYIKGSDGAHNVTTTYIVQIKPVNEFKPTFTNKSVSLNVQENLPFGTVVYVTNATDQDKGPDGEIMYSIDTGPFRIDPSSGEITVAGTLDAESNPYIQLTVWATDRGNPPYSSSQLLIVSLVDVNDNIPTCSSNPYFVSLSENSLAGDVVTSLVCRDADNDPANLNNALSYSIVSIATSQFSISTSGNITVSSGASLDRETQDNYTVIIVVSDKSPTAKLSTTVTVSVIVTDVNDNAPYFTQLSPVDLPEDATVGKTVAFIRANDKDSGINKMLEYKFRNYYDKFSIDPVTGNVVLDRSLDYELEQSYKLEILVTN